MFSQFEFHESGLRRVLGPLEAGIMESVWAAGRPVTIRDVCDALAKTQGTLAFTTIMTVMNRLTAKGYLERSGSRKNYRFSAAMSREQLEARLSQSVIREILADYGPMAINHFVEAVAADPNKLSLLEDLLEKKEHGSQREGSE